MRRPSTTAPASPATAPRRADVTDVVSPVFGSATDSLYFCELLADSDVDNDSERETDWLIELEYEPLPDVEPDCELLADSDVDNDSEPEADCEPLPDVEPDCDNDSERETDWLIELEYEPLPDVEPDCDWLTETEVLTDVEADSDADTD